jgi:GTP cyclohydrolase I
MNVQDSVRQLIEFIGDDPNREGLVETPHRVVKAYAEIFSGYYADPKELFKTFDADGYDQIIICKDIEFYSMCEHHMLPFTGKAHVAYIPGKKIIGLSKLARLVDLFARRLQIQERMTDQITSTIMENLDPKGAACIIQAEHMCMRMRGVKKQASTMVTSSMKGVFMTVSAARAELMELLK